MYLSFLPRAHPLFRSKRHGFTLLEMSIVLVIIALIMGAILGGRSFLANAELRSLMSESQIMINAFNQFNKTYQSFPGDYNPPTLERPWTGFDATTNPTGAFYGDGNGIIRAGAAANNAELFIAFQHLALSGFIKGSFTGTTNGAAGTAEARLGANVPFTSVSGVGMVFNHPDALDGNVDGTLAADAIYFNGQYGHVLWIAGSTANALPNTGFLTPARALAFDDKFDDGAPGAGWITTPEPTTATSTTACASTNVPTTAVYNTALATTPCYFFLNIPGS